MRDYHAPVHGDRPNSTHQLDRSNGNGALSNANRNRLAGKPLLLEIADLPFFRRHYPTHFIWQIDASLLPQSKSGCIFRDAVDTKLLRQRIKEDVARLINCFRKINRSMSAFHPASKASAIKSGAAIAMHVQGLSDVFLPSRGRH